MSNNDSGPRCWNDMACVIHRCRELGCACLRNLSKDNLRDEFAAAALQGILASAYSPGDVDADTDDKACAECAYRTADAMLAERTK